MDVQGERAVLGKGSTVMALSHHVNDVSVFLFFATVLHPASYTHHQKSYTQHS